MKLRREFITPYMPYELKWKCSLETETMIGITDNRIIFAMNGDEISSSYEFEHKSQSCKPILRPLSDLPNEIEHNGNKFIPMEVMFGWDITEEKEFDIYGTLPDAWKSFLAVNIARDWDYRTSILLFQWHFDVFGLIPEGIAIKI